MNDRDRSPDSAALRRLLSPILSLNEFRPLSTVVRVEFGMHSRPGLNRTVSEDHVLIIRMGRSQQVLGTTLQQTDLPINFEEYGYAMVVADGAGSRGAGGLASRVALSTLAHLAIHFGKWNLRVDDGTAQDIIDRVEFLYQRAASAVEQYSHADPVLRGMCTTLTAALSAGDELFYAHVGHSRAYVLRDGELVQLTRDHTVRQRLSEAAGPVAVPHAAQDLRHVLTDVVGAGPNPPQVEIERFHLRDNDCVLVCTDGLTNVVDDETIADVLAQGRELNEQCRTLVDLAFSSGGDDDTTVVLAKYHIPSGIG